MWKFLRFTFYVFLIPILIGCDACIDKLCGEPAGRKKVFLDSMNVKYKNDLTACQVPCYEDYIKIYLKADYQNSLIDSLETRYRKSVSYAEFLVYDKNKKLIRSSEGSM